MATSPRTALIGGTSLLEAPQFRHATRRIQETPHGPVTLLEQGGLLFLQRHGLERYTPPHRINHHANLLALQLAGAERILAVGSVGSLRLEIAPGRIVLPDDFYAPHLAITYFDDARGHRAPAFHASWRTTLLQAWPKANSPEPVTTGVYWQTIGPRFETPAEIRQMQPHAHVVGMTVASECILAGELEIPYAALCVVDNYANGLVREPLTYEGFRQQVRANETMLLATIDGLLNAIATP